MSSVEEIILYAIVGILVGFSKGGLGGPVPVALTVPLMTLIIDPQVAVALVLPLLIFADNLRPLLLLAAMGSPLYRPDAGARFDRRGSGRARA